MPSCAIAESRDGEGNSRASAEAGYAKRLNSGS
jgi:hypothetical protein